MVISQPKPRFSRIVKMLGMDAILSHLQCLLVLVLLGSWNSPIYWLLNQHKCLKPVNEEKRVNNEGLKDGYDQEKLRKRNKKKCLNGLMLV